MIHPLDGSNWTNIIFNIVPFPENVTISSTWLSILRSKFMSLVVRQSSIHLTEPLFGNASAFEVIKFPGGITIIPPQTAFLLQKPHATFNFTLNYPIYKLQDRTNELKDQMKAGLLLNPYENLYIKLTNSQGSTILPPTIVETSIVLEVGNHQPSVPRMKQLARTITNSSSSSGNLGLNHTVFGRVKQISLSSYLRHSLHSGRGSDAPSPAPMHHHGHHSHHHRHHHHSHDDNRHPAAPAPAPVHFPAPQPRYGAPPPSGGCPYSKNKPKKSGRAAPAAEPAANDHRSASIALPPHPSSPSPASWSQHAPSTPAVPPPPALPEPPLPTISFAHPRPPSERGTGTSPAPSEEATRAGPSGMSQVAPAPHSSYATRMQGDVPCCWVLFVLALCVLTSLLR
nr:unknown [Zea mays]